MPKYFDSILVLALSSTDDFRKTNMSMVFLLLDPVRWRLLNSNSNNPSTHTSAILSHRCCSAISKLIQCLLLTTCRMTSIRQILKVSLLESVASLAQVWCRHFLVILTSERQKYSRQSPRRRTWSSCLL